ncbi:beta-lactamase domain protein [Gemmatirosa kalamazoonensis]|uniref:Beta-lactamase domain protein n=1 Tax=Gemmatirosa kalamazoonensis TaxID=861299 RepID=W0RCG2_9BACT|nr:MBL fold metallo-hydrolase [Gemmatirosa kalamazoonensis]AHG88132.1 beta-lactamase domain protein [Gemmatirosa kalamazoonensis]
MIGPCRAVALRAAITVALLAPHALNAQADHYTSDLLPMVRRAAALPVGDAPTSVRFLLLGPWRDVLSTAVEGVPPDSVGAAYSVFQIRFPRGWAVVDAALDRSLVPESKRATFSDETYGQIQEALRDARLVVVTHEHHDHVGGALKSPHLAQIQSHTLLTRAQVRTLQERPNLPQIRVDSATAARYLVVDYDPIMPIAPGVVLIKAPGHTPGSQMVYVRLQSGRELLLVGDVAWNMANVRMQRQKPEASTRGFGGEDRDAIAKELRWLRDAEAAGVVVVAAHDVAWIDTLAARGALVRGFDFTNR